MENTMDVDVKKSLENGVLEKAFTLVGNRRSLLADLQKALGELRMLTKEKEEAERQYHAEHEAAMEEERKVVAALDAELEAAKKQHALRVEEARRASLNAVNAANSRVGMARKRCDEALVTYQRVKRNLAKLVSELPA